MILSRAFLLLTMLFCVVLNSQSQDNCQTMIRDAELVFESGNYDDCINILENALKDCNYSSQEKEEALIVLIRAYLEEDNIDEVNKGIVKLLKNNPNFKLREGLVQQDFVAYFNKFRVRPLLSIGVRFGIGIPQYKVTKKYSILDGVDYNAPYNWRVEGQFEISVEFSFINNLSLSSEAGYISYKYKRSITGVDSWNLDYTEKISYFEFPLYLKKYFEIKKLNYKPFLLTGLYFTRLQSAFADVELTYHSYDYLTNETDRNDISSTKIDRVDERTLNNYGVLFGLGLSHKIKNFIFSTDVRYSIGINNIMSVKNKYHNSELIYNYYYVDNDVKINKLDLSFSVHYVFNYVVKKLKDK